MLAPDKAIAIIADFYDLVESYEDSESAKFVFRVDGSVNDFNEQDLTYALGSVPSRDELQIQISVAGASDAALFRSSRLDDIESQIHGLFTYVDEDEEEEIIVTIDIVKTISKGNISIYNLDSYCSWLKCLNVSEKLSHFSGLLKDYTALHYVCLDSIEDCSSVSVSFSNEVKDFDELESLSKLRSVRNAQRMACCNFLDANSAHLTIDDFFLRNPSKHEELDGIFEHLTALVGITFIANHSALSEDGNSLSYRFEGARTIAGSLNSEERFDIGSLDILRQIIDWTYGGGQTVDKIGLARNVICISGKLFFTESTRNSILSGYEIYLRENIQDYISLKNKLTEYLGEYVEKLDSGTQRFGDNFRNILILQITFFVTVIITRSGAGKGFSDFVSREVFYLTNVFVGISFLLFLIALSNAKESVTRVRGSYAALRKRYDDILSEDDLNQTFDEKRDVDPVVLLAQRKHLHISITWVASLLLIIATVFILYLDIPILKMLRSLFC